MLRAQSFVIFTHLQRLGIACFLGAGLLLFMFSHSYAVNIQVTTNNDELNSDGDCSLREAIQAANRDQRVDACLAGRGADAVIVPVGIYLLSLTGANENRNATGDLDISDDLILRGAGPATETILDGNRSDRLLHTQGKATLTVENLTLQEGRVEMGNGGAIHASRQLILQNVNVRDNSAVYGGGVAIFDHLTIQGSEFLGNQADVSGGAIYHAVTGDAEIVNTLFARNSAAEGAVYQMRHTRKGAVSFLHATIANLETLDASALLIENGSAYVFNTIVAGHTTGIEVRAGTVFEDYNLFADIQKIIKGPGMAYSSGHNVFSDQPGFVNPLADDYRLSLTSPAIDAGKQLEIVTDFDGDQRPLSAGADIGFDEAVTPAVRVGLALQTPPAKRVASAPTGAVAVYSAWADSYK